MANIVQEPISCSTAEEFLQAISPLGPNFKDQATEDGIWLFRGQWADWPLVPSLFRKDEFSREKLQSLTKLDVNLELHKIERDILIYFFEMADKRGLVLPDDSQELRNYLDEWKNDDVLVGERARLLQHARKTFSLRALAQHYGMPTRLLDWTRQSYIAAFFAAENRVKVVDESLKEQLVVWAFYYPRLRNKAYAYTSRLDIPVQLVTAPGASNINLKAQQGLFTWYDYNNETSSYHLTLTELLQRLAAKKSQENPLIREFMQQCKFQKFTLPQKDASKLLQRLEKLDITPSSVYPGYHSILADLQMQNLPK